MKLTKALKETVLKEAVASFIKKDVQTLKDEASRIGNNVYQTYLKTSSLKIEEVVKKGIVPKDWFKWQNSTLLQINGVNFEIELASAHGYEWLYQLPTQGDFANILYLVLTRTVTLPTPEYPQSYRGSDRIDIKDSVICSNLKRLCTDIAELQSEMNKFIDEVNLVLSSCNTYKQLNELSPELAKFIETPLNSSGQLIPYETLNKVNKKLAKLRVPTA